MSTYTPIPGFEQYYEIDKYGNVRSLDRIIVKNNRWGGFTTCKIKGKSLKFRYCDGYPCVSIGYDSKFISFRISRLVALTFVSNPNNYPFVLHKDDNPSNNYVGNLMWGTHEMNMQQMDERGRRKNGSSFGTKNGCHVLNNRKVKAIRKKHSNGATMASLARLYNCGETTISRVVKIQLWKNV